MRGGATVLIGMPEAAQFTILPELFRRLQKVAPGVSIVSPRYSRESLARDLRTGTFDFTISTEAQPVQKIHGELLATDAHVSIVRQDHPSVPRRLTLKRFLALDHIAVARSVLVDPEIDGILLRQGQRRKIALTVASPGPIPGLVATTNLIATLPNMLLDAIDLPSGIARHKPPLDLEPISIYLFWHERTHSSPAHTWMRSLIKEVVVELAGRK